MAARKAPVRLASGEFAFVAITETKPVRRGKSRLYDEFDPALKPFGQCPPEALRSQPPALTRILHILGTRANAVSASPSLGAATSWSFSRPCTPSMLRRAPWFLRSLACMSSKT